MERERSVAESEMESVYSSSTSAEGFKYDVYLSFRGRFAFIDFLYTNLVAVGVRIFRDDIELRRGEEIVPALLKAIAESKICIPIFSKNYASSKWCLSELAKMVECKRSTGQLILPIFYDVKPSEVRHQSGTYEDAFKEHRRHFDQITVKKWEEALREVGSLKGWEVEKETDGYQGKLINEIIIPTVLLELKKYYMNVTDNLVGMDHHEKEMMRLLNIGSDNVRLVGIHGMGGIGKTTIAKFIYGKLLEWFECCSFLADVRETVQQRDGFLSLQKQFLADTLEQHPDIADVNSGIDMIKRIFLRKKVLIVLDDVNEKSQFAILLGKRDQFGSGSRIIVTTREKHVLNALGVDGFYEPSCLNNVQSLQLLSIHAFRSIFPPKDYVSISREIVSATFGLPLALEIIGSFLSEKEEVLWEDTLKKLKNIPDLEVQKKLSISYEALNYEQQQIFLDIACFFVGMDKTYVSYMWDGCDYNPEKEINVLCLLSLVKIGDDNLLKMHDQIRDLGREIVRQESFKNPGNRSRLWNHKEALDILEGRRGREKVEALSLHFDLRPERKPRFTSKEFKKLENLRYLRVDGTELVGNFEHLLPKLRWLNWHGCPPHFKPTNFHLKNLVILDLSNSGITEDWGGWNQFKVVNKLKVLQLANCALRRTPDFSSYASLEILILRRCKSLLGIDPSIGNLKNLRVLDISYADIRKLPDEIWMLKKLEIIDASSCYYLGEGIPSNIGSLSSLRFLSVYNNKFQSLPPSIWGLSCLQTLELVGKRVRSLPELSWNLRTSEVAFIPSHTGFVNSQGLRLTGDFEFVEFPSSVGQLCSLERLFFDSTNIRNLPQDTFAFPQLKLLHLQFCHNLQLLPTLPSSLINFSLRVCPSLETLPDLTNLTNLQQLSLKNCIKLKEIPGLGNLESLRRLGLYACHKLANLDLLEQFPCLESLEMSGCKDFEVKPDLSNLKKLEIVSIADCAELNNIQGLGKLTSLKYLFLHHCMNLRWIEDLEDLKSLVALDVSGCALLNQHPASRMVSALAMTQLQDGYVSYPWERRMQEMVSVPNSSCFVSMLFLPKASDRVASRYNDLEDTLARANAWLNASQASGVPIVFMNIQTESLLTKISGETASSIVNAGSLSDLSNLANASLYGFEDYHGLDIGVVRAARLWYAPLGGEIAVEIKLKEGDAKLGFAINRTEEGFIYISSVIDGDDNAPATRSGLSDLYKQAVIASKLLVVSRISNQKVLPWIVSPTGAIRCFDTVSLSQKLSLHRHAKVPILIHALLWDQALASPSGGNTRHRTPSIPVLPLPSEIRLARPPKFSSKSEVQSDERELRPARDRKIFTQYFD